VTERLDAQADRIADRVAPLIAARVDAILDERDAAPEPLLDAAGAARFLGVERSAVYAMAKDGRLPTIKLGDSGRPRLRFDRRALVEHLTVTPPERANGRRTRRSRSRPGLLPVKGARP
jgi:excisionase family DNA binding protein